MIKHLQTLKSMPENVKQYLLITGNYWAFTLTDGALRMLIVLHFHQLGYTPLNIALLFLFYEFFGVVTNLVGGWLGARIGLNKTMQIGLFLQIVALALLLVPTQMLTIVWVMCAQALSGIAKDLNKMSAKSAIKSLIPENAHNSLYKWIAVLTGSKNTLKGVGFFIGAALLSALSFKGAITVMAAALLAVFMLSIYMLKADLGKATYKPKFKDIVSKSQTINYLSAARLFLFSARDVWFVIALPVYLSQQFNWSHHAVGGFLALWVMGYGLMQSIAPKITGSHSISHINKQAVRWALTLTCIPLVIIGLLTSHIHPQLSIVIGLFIFGIAFAINSSVHSYLIVQNAKQDGASLDVGFYYMANAMGRLIGTVLSGWIFMAYGIEACLLISSLFLFSCYLITRRLCVIQQHT